MDVEGSEDEKYSIDSKDMNMGEMTRGLVGSNDQER